MHDHDSGLDEMNEKSKGSVGTFALGSALQIPHSQYIHDHGSLDKLGVIGQVCVLVRLHIMTSGQPIEDAAANIWFQHLLNDPMPAKHAQNKSLHTRQSKQARCRPSSSQTADQHPLGGARKIHWEP